MVSRSILKWSNLDFNLSLKLPLSDSTWTSKRMACSVSLIGSSINPVGCNKSCIFLLEANAFTQLWTVCLLLGSKYRRVLSSL